MHNILIFLYANKVKCGHINYIWRPYFCFYILFQYTIYKHNLKCNNFLLYLSVYLIVLRISAKKISLWIYPFTKFRWLTDVTYYLKKKNYININSRYNRKYICVIFKCDKNAYEIVMECSLINKPFSYHIQYNTSITLSLSAFSHIISFLIH